MAMRLVRELLENRARQIFVISPESNVQSALELMVTNRISSLPVTRGPDLVGILSERDYIRKVVPKRVAPWDILVGEIMTEKVICVTSSNTILECMELLTGNRIRHLPIVDGNILIGMLSISDIVRVLRSARIDFPSV